MTILEIIFWIALGLIVAIWVVGALRPGGSPAPTGKSLVLGILFLVAVAILGVVEFHVRLT